MEHNGISSLRLETSKSMETQQLSEVYFEIRILETGQQFKILLRVFLRNNRIKKFKLFRYFFQETKPNQSKFC